MSSLFARGKRGHDSAKAVATTGTACSMRWCTNETAQPCAYRDRRERSCPTAFCPAHSVFVAGATYCRRHAGTVEAIGSLAKNPSGLPDVSDRGPALINWIARDLDKDIRNLLARTARPGEILIVEHTGPVFAVTVRMSEDDESRIHVRVGAEIVADTVPPWIARRSEGLEVEAAIDIAQRQHFYGRLEEDIAAAIIRFRAREDTVAA
jgi:hypothetical protein